MVGPEALRRVERVFATLDWAVLGEVYCDEGGDAFWAEHREPALRLGCAWADALAWRVVRGGTSLYVGAGVAEVPAMVCEVLELGRRVVATNRRTAECEVLTAALAAAGIDGVDLAIHAGDVREHLSAGPFDHLSLVSVLTDPETWPTLAGVTYGRLPPVQLDLEAFLKERTEVEALVDALGGALARPATITTTVEEVPWLCAWAERTGAVIDADDEVIDTAIVGDGIGFLSVR